MRSRSPAPTISTAAPSATGHHISWPAIPRRSPAINSAISSQTKPDYDTNVGVEVGGAIIKNKLFFWVGFAPRLQQDHVFRFTHTLMPPDANGIEAFGPEVDRRRIEESRQTYHFGAKLDFVPAPDHRLTLSIFGSPSSGQGVRAGVGGDVAIADPAWMRETVVRNTTDVGLHWISKLYDRKWQIEANIGVHREYFNNYSPDPALNNLNQEEWWGANLWDLERTPGMPTANRQWAGFPALSRRQLSQRWFRPGKARSLPTV